SLPPPPAERPPAKTRPGCGTTRGRSAATLSELVFVGWRGGGRFAHLRLGEGDPVPARLVGLAHPRGNRGPGVRLGTALRLGVDVDQRLGLEAGRLAGRHLLPFLLASYLPFAMDAQISCPVRPFGGRERRGLLRLRR